MVFLQTILHHKDMSPDVISWFFSNVSEATKLTDHDVYNLCFMEGRLDTDAPLTSLTYLAGYFTNRIQTAAEFNSVIEFVVAHEDFTVEVGDTLVKQFFGLGDNEEDWHDLISETVKDYGPTSTYFTFLKPLLDSGKLSSVIFKNLFEAFHEPYVFKYDIEGDDLAFDIYQATLRSPLATYEDLKLCTEMISNDCQNEILRHHPGCWPRLYPDAYKIAMNTQHDVTEVRTHILLHGIIGINEKKHLLDAITRGGDHEFARFSYLALTSKHNESFSFLDDAEFSRLMSRFSLNFPSSSNALIESPRLPLTLTKGIYSLGLQMPPSKRFFIKNYAPNTPDRYIHVGNLDETLSHQQSIYISEHKHGLSKENKGSGISKDFSTILNRFQLSSNCLEHIIDQLRYVEFDEPELEQLLCKQLNNTSRTLEVLFFKVSNFSDRCQLVSHSAFPFDLLMSFLQRTSQAYRALFPSYNPESGRIFEYARVQTPEQYRELLNLANSEEGEFFSLSRKAISSHILNLHAFPKILPGTIFDKAITLEALYHSNVAGSLSVVDWEPLSEKISIDDCDATFHGTALSATLPGDFIEAALSSHLKNKTEKLAPLSIASPSANKRTL